MYLQVLLSAPFTPSCVSRLQGGKASRRSSFAARLARRGGDFLVSQTVFLFSLLYGRLFLFTEAPAQSLPAYPPGGDGNYPACQGTLFRSLKGRSCRHYTAHARYGSGVSIFRSSMLTSTHIFTSGTCRWYFLKHAFTETIIVVILGSCWKHDTRTHHIKQIVQADEADRSRWRSRDATDPA